LSIKEVSGLVDSKYAIKIIKTLWEKSIVHLDEVLIEKYTPKVELFVRVKEGLKSNKNVFNEAIEKLKNAPKQRELLLQLLVEESQSKKSIKISKFLKKYGGTHSMFRSMEEKGVVEIYDLEVSRRSEEHTSELQSRENLVCRLLL